MFNRAKCIDKEDNVEKHYYENECHRLIDISTALITIIGIRWQPEQCKWACYPGARAHLPLVYHDYIFRIKRLKSSSCQKTLST